MQTPIGPKGTRDFFPEDMAFQQFLFDSWRSSCERYGFELYDGPTFEHLEIYKQKSGNEIEDQLYTFTDKSDRALALRPELTPSLARMVASKGQSLKRPVRWYSIPRLFRYEKMQKGRLREFYQLNMDILGIENPSADAELIAASIGMMQDLGFTEKDFKVRISSRTLLDDIFTTAGLPKEIHQTLYGLLDKKGKLEPEIYEKEVSAIIPDNSVRSKIEDAFSANDLNEIKNFAPNGPSINNLETVLELLSYYGFSDYIQFDINIVRGLAYYTGIVFELFDIKKSMRAIAGGGRYDKLVELYNGPSTPAVGFAAGDVVLGDLLKEQGKCPEIPSRSSVFVVAVDDSSLKDVIAITQKLRDERISAEFSLKNQVIGKQLKIANAARSKVAIFVGGDEGAKGQVKIKDMAKGEEITTNINDLIPSCKKLLNYK